jgi:hypothetical protein
VRRRGKVDGNHAAIVARFREWGWSVQSLADIGNGCPDLLVCPPSSGPMRLVEVKMPKTGRLTADQLRWHDTWNGPVLMATTTDDVDELALGRHAKLGQR